MMRSLLAALVAVVCIVAATRTAHADRSGSFGVGYDRSMAGHDGISVSYIATDKLTAQLTLSYVRVDGPLDNDDASDLGLTLMGRWALIQSGNVNVNLGFGLDIGSDDGAGPDNGTGLAFMVGFGPEYFLTPSLAVHVLAGLVIDLDSGGLGGIFPGIDGDDTSFSIGGPVLGLAGNFGLTYYF